MKRTNGIILLLALMVSCRVTAQQDEPFCLQKNWYSKQMVDVFEDLSKNKLQKVEEDWQDIEKKFGKEKNEGITGKGSAAELLFPVWQLSRCVLLNAKEGRTKLKSPLATAYDPWQSYSELKEVLRNGRASTWANRFFESNKLTFSVVGIKADIEKNLIDTVRAVATEEAYDRLIDTVVDCWETNTLRAEREQVAFKSTMLTDDVGKCNGYLKKYVGQSRQHEDLVASRRDSLAFVQMDTTISDCQQYLKDYPKSIYKDEVAKRLHRYEFNQLGHTSEACQEYLAKYPHSAYAKQVGELKVQYAFEEAKAQNAIEAFRSFLAEYMNSSYAVDRGYLDGVQQLLTQALKSKYISHSSSLNDLTTFLKQDNGQYADIADIRQYYYNLLHLPTSASMNGCNGLTGTVTTTYSQNGEYVQDIMEFNQQGLLSKHTNSKSGLSYSYSYVFDSVHGFQLSERTDHKRNRTISYATKYNANGALEEISGNDGSKTCYSYNGDQLYKISYMRNDKVEHTDIYNDRTLLEKSVRGSNTIVYEYNEHGDAVSMKKMKGSATLSNTTYVYEYDKDLPWQSMEQYNDGSFLLRKTRSYEMTEEQMEAVRQLLGADIAETASLPGLVEEVEEVKPTATTYDKVFDVVEQMPSFKGGDEALLNFLNLNVHYPIEAEENGIQGRVVCSFVVERDGSITEVKVTKSADPSLDKEAVRVLQSMPKWIPGTQNGKPVRVKYTTPVTFRLQ